MRRSWPCRRSLGWHRTLVAELVVNFSGLLDDQVGAVAFEILEDRGEEPVREVIDVALVASRPTITSRSVIMILHPSVVLV